RIHSVDAGYAVQPAAYDQDSETPRCHRHWRFVCELCLRPFHYQAMSLCADEGATFCERCALRSRVVEKAFWYSTYTWERQCPLCAAWHYALDFAEHEGADLALPSISTETRLT